MTYLSVHNFTLRTTSRLLIHNLDFELKKGSFLSIVGHNGAGKTTFLKALLGQALFEGFVRFQKKNFTHSSIEKRLGAGYLSQKHSFNFDIPVIELVVMGRYKHTTFFQKYSKSDYALAQVALKEVGLSGFEHRDFLALSGGEQQLVLIAQLITQESEIILLDEPTQSLDIRNKSKIMKVIKSLHESGKTIIITTHDIDYLTHQEGYILNFSEESPQLKPISPEQIERTKSHLIQK